MYICNKHQKLQPKEINLTEQMSCEKSSSSYTTQIQLQDPNIKIYKDVITLN